MREEALRLKGRYLFACPSIELIGEQVDRVKRINPSFPVYAVHSDSKIKGKVIDSVRYRKGEIEGAGIDHAIIFITHETLMGHDLNDFNDWHLRIDEAPSGLHSGVMDAKISYDFIEKQLASIAGQDDWGLYKLVASVGYRHAEKDPTTAGNANFYKQAGRPAGIFVNQRKLRDLKKFEWFSIWIPSDLTTFASIHIAASSYYTSLGFKALDYYLPQACRFNTKVIGSVRTGQPNIEIKYFTDSHEGSTAFWDESEGRHCIKEVCDHIAQATPDLDFWSANDLVYKLIEHRIAGEHISPLAMGLNKFRDKTKCAFIYSSKPLPSDQHVVDTTNLVYADFLLARETEAIKQFVMRGAIRNLDYDGDYLIYLYEKAQAEAIRQHLTNNGFTNVTLGKVASTFVGSHVRPVKKASQTEEEKYERQKDMNKAKSQKLHKKKLVEKWAQAVIAAKVPKFEDLPSKKHWRTSSDHLIPDINAKVNELRGLVPPKP